MSLLDDYVNVTSVPNGGASGGGGGIDVVASDLDDRQDEERSRLGMFRVDQVTLPGSLNIVSAAVQNNILFLALAIGRLMRIDLAEPAEILDIEIPRTGKSGDVDAIHKIHLDPTGSHLVISLQRGDNLYWHQKLGKVAKLGKVKGVIEAIGWSPDGNKHSTKEILIALKSGSVYESWIESAEGFTRSLERHVKLVWTGPEGSDTSLTGLHMYKGATSRDRHVLIATNRSLLHFSAQLAPNTSEGPSLAQLFTGQPGVHACEGPLPQSILRIVPDDDAPSKLHFAWACDAGVLHGPAPTCPAAESSFEDASMLPHATEISKAAHQLQMIMTAYHILVLYGRELHAYNRLDRREVYHERLSEPEQVLAITSDAAQQTYWLHTQSKLFEIVVTDEARELWDVYLKRKDFASAAKHASGQRQIDLVNEAEAQNQMSSMRFDAAAEAFAKSSAPVEQVALAFMAKEERDALRLYLTKKLELARRNAEMQRMMLATWIIELLMNKMNALDDLQNIADGLRKDAADGKKAIEQIKNEFERFVQRYRVDLDPSTIYALISSYGREDELLTFANVVGDYHYIVHYQIGKDRYAAALEVLVKHPEIDLMYATAGILLPEIPTQVVELWMRVTELEPLRLLPAILLYSSRRQTSLADNQAVRYLQFAIRNRGEASPAIHNALIGIYARDCGEDESELLAYIRSQGREPRYDTDFALRQCREHGRTISCVNIYANVGLYEQALELALRHDDIDLAKTVADRVDGDPSLRKKFWLSIATVTIERRGISAAIELSKENDVLRIEDLLPHFTDDTPLDEFKEDICTALESYADRIADLQREMESSDRATETIGRSLQELDRRLAVVHLGDICFKCDKPLLQRQFFVFPCQHAFHSDCLLQNALQNASATQRRRIAQLQTRLSRSAQNQATSAAAVAANRARSPTPSVQSRASSVRPNGSKPSASTTSAAPLGRQAVATAAAAVSAAGAKAADADLARAREELDDLIAAECILCGGAMIKAIDRPFVDANDRAMANEAASWKI